MKRNCKVSITDFEHVTHSVFVDAESLFEAVALGLARIRRFEWSAGLPQGLTKIHVEVCETVARHTVVYQDFEKWLQRPGVTPKERTTIAKAREAMAR